MDIFASVPPGANKSVSRSVMIGRQTFSCWRYIRISAERFVSAARKPKVPKSRLPKVKSDACWLNVRFALLPQAEEAATAATMAASTANSASGLFKKASGLPAGRSVKNSVSVKPMPPATCTAALQKSGKISSVWYRPNPCQLSFWDTCEYRS